MQKDKYIGMELDKTRNMLQRAFARADLRIRLDKATNKNSWIISYLAENTDKDIFQRDIEDKFSLRRSTVSTMLTLMEKKGYIERQSVDYDARLKKIVLTPKAAEINRQLLEGITASEEQMRRGITDEELEVFFAVLAKIQKNLE